MIVKNPQISKNTKNDSKKSKKIQKMIVKNPKNRDPLGVPGIPTT